MSFCVHNYVLPCLYFSMVVTGINNRGVALEVDSGTLNVGALMVVNSTYTVEMSADNRSGLQKYYYKFSCSAAARFARPLRGEQPLPLPPLPPPPPIGYATDFLHGFS